MKNNIFSTIIVATSLFITAQVSAELASTGSYKIDPAHTSVQFTINHLGIGNLNGRFNTVEGSFNFKPNGKSSVEVTIQTNSLDTNHLKRDTHLRSPDFFNVKQFPVIKFVSNSVKYNAKGEPTSMTGKLTLHGQTQVTTLKITPVGAGKDPWGGYRAGYDVNMTIKRSDFGMKFMLSGIGDEINITMSLEATKI